MVKHNQHIIQQQILELDVPPAMDVHKLSQAVAQHLRTHTMFGIEALFDRFVTPENTLKLDHVEIDLGNLGSSDWQKQIESRLLAKLTDVLKQAAAQNDEQSFTAEQGRDDFEQWLYFLHHGRLPSWATSTPNNWPQQCLLELDSNQWQSLLTTLTHNDHALSRLRHTLNDKTLATVVENLFGLREVLRILTLCFPTRLPREQQSLWRTQFWQSLLEPMPTSDEHKRGIVFMRRLLQLQANFDIPLASTHKGPSVVPELPEPWRGWLAAIQGNTKSFTITNLSEGNKSRSVNDTSDPSASESLLETPTEQSNTSQPHLTPDAQRGATNDVSEPPEFAGKRRAPSESSLHVRYDVTEQRRNDGLMSIDEVVHINGAGCIILHPFLEELFRSTNLLEDCDFRDAASREKAVHLLSRLTFGDEAIPEYELLLPKLLCSMAWEEPLSPIELSDEERYACDELLEAVLRHWQALKSCSAEWLREQFFLRPASLEQVDEGWRLTVERRAQDVLLDRLPWGLGVIALPWRHGLIYVRWME